MIQSIKLTDLLCKFDKISDIRDQGFFTEIYWKIDSIYAPGYTNDEFSS